MNDIRLDHVLIGGADLDTMTDWWETTSGVRPAYGGQHPGLGTHNALVAAGPDVYIEFLAPDPGQGIQSPITDQLAALPHPQPVGWAFGCDDAADTAAELTARGVEVLAMPTTRQDGDTLLEWTLLFPAHDLGPVVPFLIDWEATPRPGPGLPEGCVLNDATPIHPDPVAAAAFLTSLGIERTVEPGEASGLRFTIDTPNGPIELAP